MVLAYLFLVLKGKSRKDARRIAPELGSGNRELVDVEFDEFRNMYHDFITGNENRDWMLRFKNKDKE